MTTYTLVDAPISRHSSLAEVDAWIKKLRQRVTKASGDAGLKYALESAKRVRKDVAKGGAGRAS